MAGTLTRAGGEIVRRATAAGLTGLTIALLIGVLSFALTTRPSGQQQEESVTRYFAVPGRVVEFSAASLGHTSTRVAEVLPGTGVPGEVDASAPFAESSADQRPANARPLEASQRVISVPDGSLPRALSAPRGDVAPESEPESVTGSMAAVATEAAPPPPAEPAVAAAVATPALTTTPVLVAGDQITATVSFYYCEHSGAGGNAGDGGAFCGAMRDGNVVHPGAAACAYDYLGQRFRIVGDPTGREYTCADTGSAVHGLHRDIWFMSSDEGWAWQQQVGQVATIEILP